MVLCEAKTAMYKPTSDGDDATKALWDSQRTAAMGLEELVDLFRRAHRRRSDQLVAGATRLAKPRLTTATSVG